MVYFVAEDLTHVRMSSDEFVSRCGFVYPPTEVDWAGDYWPEAYDRCESCTVDSTDHDGDAEGLLLVRGVYAVEDDAHLWFHRSTETWISVCGREDPNFLVAWAGDEWPVAYDACANCLALVEWQPDHEEIHEPTEEDRYRDYRVWVVQDHVQHRARDRELTQSMCGVDLRGGVTPRFTQTSGPAHCHACDTAVGRARAGLPFQPPQTRPPVSALRQAPVRTGQQSERNRRAPAESTTAHPSRRPTAPRRRSGATVDKLAAKEIALFGRKMVVPLRFVRGGAPGLGRRR